MLLTKEKLQHINTIAHEGKVVVFATDAEGKIHYTIKQDGFEDSYLRAPEDQRTGWEDWQELEFPNEPTDDQSVVKKETEELTHKDDPSQFILRSRYRTQDQSAVAPVQIVSGVGHIYVFRQSKADAIEVSPNTLLVDRFVLDGMTNKLVRKLDVRFKRSRQKYEPLGSMQKKADGEGLANVDTLDHCDADGKQFYEPTTELSLIKNLHNGWFSVVQVATNEHDIYRWHIFAYNSESKKVELTTIRASEEGLFDVRDYTVFEAKPEVKNALVPRSISGIIQRSLDLGAVKVANGFSATKYDIQKEQKTEEGMQLLKDATKVMLAIPTNQGNVAAISFSVAADGTLSQIDETPDETIILRSNCRELLLPLNSLDEIKGIGDSTPPPLGKITGVKRGEEDAVQIISPKASDLKTGDVVKITGTKSYNGHYVPTNIDEDSFEIEASYVNGDIGKWEKVPEKETGLIFDGAITSFERVANNKLKIASLNHGLEDGDEVQIIDTTDYNRTCGIKKVDGKNFIVEGISWKSGQAVNLKLQSRKRRGVMFNDRDEYIAIPKLKLTRPSTEFAVGYTISAWVWVSENSKEEQIIVGEKKQCLQLLVNKGTVSLKVKFADNSKQLPYTAEIHTGQWIHYAGVVTSDGTSKKTTLTLCKNGKEVATQEVTGLPDTPKDWKPEFEIGKTFAGKIADVQIWDKARTDREIKDSMYLQLTGREVDLVGYWRLGAILEEKERKVVDFSANGNDGIVHGDAFVSAITLNRTLKDKNTQVVKYSNDELVAVTSRATYEETFEFKINDPKIKPNNVDGKETKLFDFSYWGKKSRSSEAEIPFTTEKPGNFKSLDNNWYQATCRFTISDEVAMMRTFELSNVAGTWSTLEIRKHRVQLISDSITQVKYSDNFILETLADKYSQLQEQLNSLEQLEREKARLTKEKSQLESDIEKIKDISKLNKEIEKLTEEKNKLTEEKNELAKQYKAEEQEIINYVCNIKIGWNKGSIRGLCRLHSQDDSHLVYLEVKENNTWKRVSTNEKPNGIHYLSLSSVKENTSDCLFKIERDYRASGKIDVYSLHVKVGNSWKKVEPEDNLHDRHLNVSNKHGLWIVKTDEASNKRIENAKTELDNKQTELANKRKDLEHNEGLRHNESTNQQKLRTKQQEVTKKLTKVKKTLKETNGTVIDTVSSTNKTTQELPELHTVEQGSQKGLVTKGALLGFASPVSRISAMETCEGKVQLSYFDNQGRMRLTNYDATSDSKDSTFEQWLPDELPVCLNFSGDKDKIQLKEPIRLGQESTIEAWFSYPLPEKTWNVLTSSDGETDISQVVVYEGKWLGTRINGLFEDCGYDLKNLANGWHHLTVVRSISEAKATTTYFIDGKKIGEFKSRAALEFNGEDNYVQFSSFKELNPERFTISLWAKATKETSDYVSLITSRDNADSKNKGYMFYIGQNNTWEFWAGNGTSNWQIINKNDAKNDVKLNTWTHLAGVYDGECLKFYINGVLFNKLETKFSGNTKRPLRIASGATENDTANYFFSGQIAEVRIWTTPRSEEQIQNDMGKVLKGNESGLVGYWSLKANSVKDLTNQKRDGILHGQPKVLNPSEYIDNISTIGNTKSGGSQFGKLAELRVWNLALSEAEIAVNSKTRLSGNEPGLVAYYPLNEVHKTTVANKTGRGNAGTVDGATWWGCAAPIGNLGHKVMEFDGKRDYVDLGTPSNLNFGGNQAYTMEAWIKPEAEGTIISKSNTNVSAEYSLFITSSGTIRATREVQPWILDSTDKKINFGQWNYVAATYNGTKLAIYINGELAASKNFGSIKGSTSAKVLIGASQTDNQEQSNYFPCHIAEVRIWNQARTAEEIKANMHLRLTGKEQGLVGYWALDDIQRQENNQKVLDLSGKENHGTVKGGIIKNDNTLPIGGDALVSAEYSTVGIDKATQKKSAVMRRFLASCTPKGAELLPDKRVEEIELKWIGNAQFKPTLLGYIEGAPPIPSENLTVEETYKGATSVELTMSKDVSYSWNRSQESGLGAVIEMFMGIDTDSHVGFGVTTKAAALKLGFKGGLDFNYNFLNETSISSSSSLSMSDRLELRGTQEQGVHFPHLGKRFIPKNVGYALVVSGLADVFITRLARTKKMIGSQVQPVDGIPLDVNTITFLINPTYTMNGSLDGMTGSSATSDRFFRHVPEMRAQYGSLYPASYYRLQEAYNLKQQIEKEDKRRESYFAQFNVRLIDETSLARNTESGEDVPEISLEREEDKPDENITKEKQEAKDNKKQKQLEKETKAGAKEQKDAIAQRKKEINSKIEQQDSRVHATESFASWQKTMENIQIKAGKRNIVNTYVWDADGGLRAEAQSFANTAEHTIGGSFSLNFAGGVESEFGLFGAAAELTAQATVNLTQTMTKTETHSKGFELNVDLSGVESTGITDHDDYPIQPGEKVNRYRFMSFYLEGTTKNFSDFFEYVVDPEWLASNAEDAQALRQTKAGKANKTWRVLHRVTYVERPALMGFGQDTRQIDDENLATQEILDYFHELNLKNQELKAEIEEIKNSNQDLSAKLDLVLNAITAQATQAIPSQSNDVDVTAN